MIYNRLFQTLFIHQIEHLDNIKSWIKKKKNQVGSFWLCHSFYFQTIDTSGKFFFFLSKFNTSIIWKTQIFGQNQHLYAFSREILCQATKLIASSKYHAMDQRALQVLSIYIWHCIKGLTKPYGHFTVEV